MERLMGDMAYTTQVISYIADNLDGWLDDISDALQKVRNDIRDQVLPVVRFFAAAIKKIPRILLEFGSNKSWRWPSFAFLTSRLPGNLIPMPLIFRFLTLPNSVFSCSRYVRQIRFWQLWEPFVGSFQIGSVIGTIISAAIKLIKAFLH